MYTFLYRTLLHFASSALTKSQQPTRYDIHGLPGSDKCIEKPTHVQKYGTKDKSSYLRTPSAHSLPIPWHTPKVFKAHIPIKKQAQLTTQQWSNYHADRIANNNPFSYSIYYDVWSIQSLENLMKLLLPWQWVDKNNQNHFDTSYGDKLAGPVWLKEMRIELK